MRERFALWVPFTQLPVLLKTVTECRGSGSDDCEEALLEFLPFERQTALISYVI